MVALMLDNGVYGLTKNQTSPTTPMGYPSNTQPRGAILNAMNPITATLGVTNASFVAQTGDWIPDHLYETIAAGFRHKGFAFIRVLQRCPQYTTPLFDEAVRNPDLVEFMVHPNGIPMDGLEEIYKHQIPHDPSDLDNGRRLAEADERIRLGLFYQNADIPCLDEVRQLPLRTAEEKIELLNAELDKYAV
jgi:2-oxoglutarate ferredoxin oxidoreductase subunit beta